MQTAKVPSERTSLVLVRGNCTNLLHVREDPLEAASGSLLHPSEEQSIVTLAVTLGSVVWLEAEEKASCKESLLVPPQG